MHQPFIHMMQRSGDRNSCGYAGGPQPFNDIFDTGFTQLTDLTFDEHLSAHLEQAFWPLVGDGSEP
jgi:hypothetical protein